MLSVLDDLGPSPTLSPSPHKGPIIRGMLKEIQEASDAQNPLKPKRIKLLLKWANEDIKIKKAFVWNVFLANVIGSSLE